MNAVKNIKQPVFMLVLVFTDIIKLRSPFFNDHHLIKQNISHRMSYTRHDVLRQSVRELSQ